MESQGFDVDYVYAVLRPYIVVLYKANPVERARKDMIALFVQPATEESCVAHILTCYLPHEVHPPAVRRFQQFIFGGTTKHLMQADDGPSLFLTH